MQKEAIDLGTTQVFQWARITLEELFISIVIVSFEIILAIFLFCYFMTIMVLVNCYYMFFRLYFFSPP